jgi:hypothetical protein
MTSMALMTLVKDSTTDNRLLQQITETNNRWQNARRAADIADFRGFGPTAKYSAAAKITP